MIDSIRHKVHFFSLVSQRNYKLQTDGGDTIRRDQLSTLHFRDSGLRNGSKLKLVPPTRDNKPEKQSEPEDDEEAEEN